MQHISEALKLQNSDPRTDCSMGMLRCRVNRFSTSLSIYQRLYSEQVQNNYIAWMDLTSQCNFFPRPFLSPSSTAIQMVHSKRYWAILSIQAISICLTQLESFSNQSPSTPRPLLAHFLILAHLIYLLISERKKNTQALIKKIASQRTGLSRSGPRAQYITQLQAQHLGQMTWDRWRQNSGFCLFLFYKACCPTWRTQYLPSDESLQASSQHHQTMQN